MLENLFKRHPPHEKILGLLLSPQALMWKALDPQSPSLAMFKKALKRGANINQPNSKGYLALHTLIVNRASSDYWKLALHYGADPNISESGVPVLHHFFRYQSISFNTEVESPAYALYQALLDQGADLTLKDNQDRSLLSYAVQVGPAMFTSHLNLNQEDGCGLTLPASLFRNGAILHQNQCDDCGVTWSRRVVEDLFNRGVEDSALAFESKDTPYPSALMIDADLSKSVLALVRMIHGRFDEKAKIEQDLQINPDFLTYQSLPEWMIQAGVPAAFAKALEWQGILSESDYQSMQGMIGREFLNNPESRQQFEAVLLQHRLQNTLEEGKETTLKSQHRL